MIIKATLFKIGESASDGSVISREVLEKYLASNNYKEIIGNRVAFACITHKDRYNKGSVKYVGEDDKVLINKSNVGYISSMSIEGDYCVAEITLYDEKDFLGESAENISYIKGMHKQGTKLPVSAVINASWDAYEKAKQINNIEGCDFTLNPAFGKNSKVIEVKL